MATKNKPQAEETAAVVPAMPDYMKAFIEQSKADTGSLISSSISVPRLSYRGKRWRWIVDGDEEIEKSLAVNVIIVGVEPDAGRFIKTFYASAYTPGDTTPPDCSSSNGINPDSWVTSPQSNRCQNCPKNIFGSATARDGKGKAKACHDSKRLWVIKPNDPEIVYGLNVPIMSLKNLSEYGKYIAKNNYPLALLVTELSMDDDSEFPKLCFKHAGFVQEDMSKDCIELNQSRPLRVGATAALPFDGPTNPAPAALPAGVSFGPAANQPPVTNGQIPERKQGTENIDDIIGNWS
jgi:hypothetical protein